MLLREPNGLRVAGLVVQAAVRLDLTASEALAVDIDRHSPSSAQEFLSKQRLTKMQNLLNPLEHHHLVYNKLHFHEACVLRGVPAPPVLAIVDFADHEAQARTLGVPRLTQEQEFTGYLRALPQGTRLIVKGIEASHGEGLLAITTVSEGNVDLEGRRLAATDIWRHCRRHRAFRGFILQPWLEPDPALRPIMPSQALGTVRLTTVILKGQPRILYGSIKLPVGSNIYDNFSGGVTGNLIADVDVESGRLGNARGSTTPPTFRLEVRERHPDTGATIKGFQLPHWPESLQTVLNGAAAFPELRTVGWDVAITSTGILLLEGNHNWDPAAPQITLQRGIRSEMEALLAEVKAEAKADELHHRGAVSEGTGASELRKQIAEFQAAYRRTEPESRQVDSETAGRPASDVPALDADGG